MQMYALFLKFSTIISFGDSADHSYIEFEREVYHKLPYFFSIQIDPVVSHNRTEAICQILCQAFHILLLYLSDS